MKCAFWGIVMTDKTKWNAAGIAIGGLAAVTAILALGLPGSYALPLTLGGIILGGAAGNAVAGRRSR